MAVRGREGSGVPQVGQDKREAFSRAGRGCEGWEWSVIPPRGPGEVGKLS